MRTLPNRTNGSSSRDHPTYLLVSACRHTDSVPVHPAIPQLWVRAGQVFEDCTGVLPERGDPPQSGNLLIMVFPWLGNPIRRV